MNKEAERIIEEHDVMGMIDRGDPQGVIQVMRDHPEHKGDMMGMILEKALEQVREHRPSDMASKARREMIKRSKHVCITLDAMNDGFKLLGRSPLINDKTEYEGVSHETSDKMVAEDLALGLRVYNCCAEYCRIYNVEKNK